MFLDNRMSLTSGDMKDEQSWTETMPLVRRLTAGTCIDPGGPYRPRKHQGIRHEDQGVAVRLCRIAARRQVSRRRLAFKLEFTKARRRRPANRQEFESVIFSIVEDTWTAEPAERPNSAGFKSGNVSPTRRPFYDALVAAIGKSAVGSGETTNEAWELEARTSWIDRTTATERRQGKLATARCSLPRFPQSKERPPESRMDSR